MEYKYLLDIGLIILSVKIFSMITGKFHMPKMIGGLIAGVVLGPAVLNIIQSSSTIEFLSNLGIIFIMFLAGMETSLKKFMANTKNFVIIAIIGVIVPLLFGFLFSMLYTLDTSLNLFFGIVITSTSVSITVESLMEMKKLKTNVGTAILGAGVVDDIIGIVFLTLVLNSGKFSILAIVTLVAKVIVFFLIATSCGFVMFRFFEWLEEKMPKTEELPIFSIAFALLLSYVAQIFGVSGIIGAYIAGLVVGNTTQGKFIKNKVDVLVYMFFSPIFFAGIGLKLTTLSFDSRIWQFIILFTIITIASKIIGNGFGAKICGYKPNECIQIGIGMATRGEVSFIMITEAKKLGLINEEIFSIIVITILLVTLITPILLNLSFRKKHKPEKEIPANA